jgi:hypothetical protein
MPNIIKAWRREQRQQLHKARLLELDRFWWTRNMTNTDAARFIDGRHGGLLSGASFDKDPYWAAKQKVAAMGPMSRSEKKEMMMFFMDYPNMDGSNFVWR